MSDTTPYQREAAVVAGDVLQVLHAPEAGCYLACYVEGPSRERIIGLFGTDTLPLPWTSSSPAQAVVDDVRRLNPEAEVIAP